MPNPLSSYGVSDTDYAMTVGMVMGEAMHEGLVGMGIVAATGLNRAQTPGAYLARSASLGDVFAAPFSAETMIDATRRGQSLHGKGRQFSPTFNKDIRGASTAGHANFRAGLEAALMASVDPSFSPVLGARQDSFERAKLATEVATKARAMGIDLGFGVEHFSAPGFEGQAGVGRNRSRFGGHSFSPTSGWPAGVTPPTEAELAARFAAAAALTGVEIPENYHADILQHATPAEISMAASTMQMQAQQHLAKQGIEAMPGMNYSDLVRETPFDAVNVPNMVGQYNVDPVGPLGFAEHFGITPTNDYDAISLPDPIGRVDFAGYLDAVGPSPIDGPTTFSARDSFAPAGAFSRDPLGDLRGFTSPDAAAVFSGQPMGAAQSFGFGGLGGLGGFNAPGMIDQAGFESRWSGGYPASMVDMGYPETDMGIVSPGALGFGSQFGIEASSWDPSGYAAGFDAGPWGNIPDHSAPSLEARNNFDRQMGRVEGWNGGAWNSSDLNADAIADRVNAELGRPQTRTETYTEMQPRTREVMEQVDVPFDMQAAYAGDWADKIGVERSFAPQQRTVARTVTDMVPVQKTRTVDLPSLPAPVDIGAPPSIAGPDYGSLVDTTFGMGKPMGGFMDAMANPMAASSYMPGTMMSTDPFMDAMANPTLAGQFSPGWRDGWTGSALTGAGWGLLTGGVPGALVGGVVGALNPFGRVSAHLSNSFGSNPGYAGSGRYGDTFSNARGFVDPGGWSLSNLNSATLAALASGSIYGQHPSTIGAMLGLDGIRSDGRGTGDTGYGGGTLGDGSYSSESGRNDNNPQGII